MNPKFLSAQSSPAKHNSPNKQGEYEGSSSSSINQKRQTQDQQQQMHEKQQQTIATNSQQDLDNHIISLAHLSLTRMPDFLSNINDEMLYQIEQESKYKTRSEKTESQFNSNSHISTNCFSESSLLNIAQPSQHTVEQGKTSARPSIDFASILSSSASSSILSPSIKHINYLPLSQRSNSQQLQQLQQQQQISPSNFLSPCFFDSDVSSKLNECDDIEQEQSILHHQNNNQSVMGTSQSVVEEEDSHQGNSNSHSHSSPNFKIRKTEFIEQIIKNPSQLWENPESYGEDAFLLELYLKIDKNNVNKNILSSFMNYILLHGDIIVLECIDSKQKEFNTIRKELKNFIRNKKLNNKTINSFFNSERYKDQFLYYLRIYAIDYFQKSKVLDKDSHFICIAFFIRCFYKAHLRDHIVTYNKSKYFKTSNKQRKLSQIASNSSTHPSTIQSPQLNQSSPTSSKQHLHQSA